MDVKAELKQFKDAVDRLAALISVPPELLPTYGRTEDSARPHIEFAGGMLHFVVVERGQVLERITSPDTDSILYEVFCGVTFSMACKDELHHRNPHEDPRRLMFDMQLRLLGAMSLNWQQRRRSEVEEVLLKNPFVDP